MSTCTSLLSSLGNATSIFNEANTGIKYYNKTPCESREMMMSTHRCCAERRLLDSWVQQARRQGVPSHKMVAWVRRKFGSNISVIRYRHDGTLGCAVPCVFCQKELERYDMRVHCVDSSGQWCDARCRDGTLPKPVLTAGQRRMLNK